MRVTKQADGYTVSVTHDERKTWNVGDVYNEGTVHSQITEAVYCAFKDCNGHGCVYHFGLL